MTMNGVNGLNVYDLLARDLERIGKGDTVVMGKEYYRYWRAQYRSEDAAVNKLIVKDVTQTADPDLEHALEMLLDKIAALISCMIGVRQ